MIDLSVVAGAALAHANSSEVEQFNASMSSCQVAGSEAVRAVTDDWPDSMIAAWKGGGPSGAEGPKDVTRLSTEKEPALSPKIVTRLGSPPKLAILRWTQPKARR